jgi:hypothetical protein
VGGSSSSSSSVWRWILLHHQPPTSCHNCRGRSSCSSSGGAVLHRRHRQLTQLQHLMRHAVDDSVIGCSMNNKSSSLSTSPNLLPPNYEYDVSKVRRTTTTTTTTLLDHRHRLHPLLFSKNKQLFKRSNNNIRAMLPKLSREKFTMF